MKSLSAAFVMPLVQLRRIGRIDNGSDRNVGVATIWFMQRTAVCTARQPTPVYVNDGMCFKFFTI